MKNIFFIFAIILLAVSIVATPFIFNLMDDTNVTIATVEPTEFMGFAVDTTYATIDAETEETTEPTNEATDVTESTVEETVVPAVTEEPELVTEPTFEETEPVEEIIVEETEAALEETSPKAVINEVPLYNQWDYPDVYYGERENVTVATHGDGMTTFAMIASYLKDDYAYTPDVIAEKFGHYDSEQGTSWTLFTEGAKELELGEVRQAWEWNVGGIEDALRNGSIVACCVVNSPFSENGGHYILLTGITEDGKIMVNDSNGYNYNSLFLKPMFKNGFDAKYIYNCAKSYWIYPPKDI